MDMEEGMVCLVQDYISIVQADDNHIREMKDLVILQWLALSLPIVDMVHDHLGCGLGRVLAADTLDEIAIGVWTRH